LEYQIWEYEGMYQETDMRERCIKNSGLKHKGKKLFGKPRHTWQDNIEKGLGEYDDVDWVNLAENKIHLQASVNIIMNLRGKFSTSWACTSFSRRM
jgi:hypothetical protein